MDSICYKVAFAFGLNGCLLCFYESPNMLVHFGADQNVAFSSGGTITLRSVDGITDHSELHAIRRANEPMYDFTAVDSDTKIAASGILKLTRFIQL